MRHTFGCTQEEAKKKDASSRPPCPIEAGEIRSNDGAIHFWSVQFLSFLPALVCARIADNPYILNFIEGAIFESKRIVQGSEFQSGLYEIF